MRVSHRAPWRQVHLGLRVLVGAGSAQVLPRLTSGDGTASLSDATYVLGLAAGSRVRRGTMSVSRGLRSPILWPDDRE